MGLLELGLALVLCGAAGIGSAVPVAAWSRTRDPRFLLVAATKLTLLAVGLLWLWGQLPDRAASVTEVSAPALGLVALVAVLLLSTALVRRRP
jgi:hypothetical protein